MTISGPAQFLPELQAGIEAKKAELQRERDAQAREELAADVPAETPTPAPDAEPSVGDSGAAAVTAAVDVPAETPTTEPALDAQDLDAPAPGWPAGTTNRDVREAMKGAAAWQQQWTEHGPDTQGWRSEPPIMCPTTTMTTQPEPVPDDVPAGTPAPAKVTDAEALLALGRDALAAEHTTHPATSRARRPQLTVQVDPISGWGRQRDGELLPPCSLRQVLKTLPGRGGLLRLRPVTDADLRRHDLGRDQRAVSAALRELLGTLDGERCRFPGCTRHRTLHAHHVRFWSDNGPTDLANLVLVCSRHHTLIHSQGFTLSLHPDRRLEVHTADGVALLHHPTQPWGDAAGLDPDRGVLAQTLQPDHCTARIDLTYAVNVLVQQAA